MRERDVRWYEALRPLMQNFSELIREVRIHDEAFVAIRLSIMRIMARGTNAATVAA
jgi:hypothetical protein